MSTNSIPVPQADLAQLLALLTQGQNQADSDTTQSIINDWQSPNTEFVTLTESATATAITGPYQYDDAGHSKWGFAQYA